MSLFFAIWQLGHEAYGDFILPSPIATLEATWQLLQSAETWRLAAATFERAFQGFVLTALLGGLIGIAVGYSFAAMRLARPLLTILLGVPPIAWIVLAMIWFGSGRGTVLTTTLVAAFPLVFANVAEAVATRDRSLEDMGRVFGAGPLQRVWTVVMRQVASSYFPSLAIALGTSFKVAVMAELLANIDGIGLALAMSRANLDVAQSIAWVVLIVAAIIVVEYGLIHPVRSEFERWREAARPWGVKR
ncbi:MAG TPA: ABC transporter permease subunit [Hyphomicrobium sp.]|nr:ABC transporter permease subunit [Hyphomicrobium sp.]